MNESATSGASGIIALLGGATAILAPACGWGALAAVDTFGGAAFLVWIIGGGLAVVGWLVGIVAGIVAIAGNKHHGKTGIGLCVVAIVTWCIEWVIMLSVSELPNLKF